VGLARAHVAGVCQAWQLGEDVTGVLAVITSELVTNAVIHARGPHVIVDVMLSRRHVWVSVIDQGCPRAPIAARVAGEGAEDGRGLLLVDALATRWHATTRASGSRVWACVRLAPRDGPPHGTPLR
jgi:anti-sigma regulatory factor (Ser/Thr protein kinase)